MWTAGSLLCANGELRKRLRCGRGGAVCWLLNYRQKIRESLPKEDEEQEEDEEPDEEIRS